MMSSSGESLPSAYSFTRNWQMTRSSRRLSRSSEIVLFDPTPCIAWSLNYQQSEKEIQLLVMLHKSYKDKIKLTNFCHY